MTGGACFACARRREALAAELAGLVEGTWEITRGVAGVILIANGATVPRILPGQVSDEALAWWHKSVTTALARTPRPSEARHPRGRP
jgi:hypothetical protein